MDVYRIGEDKNYDDNDEYEWDDDDFEEDWEDDESENNNDEK